MNAAQVQSALKKKASPNRAKISQSFFKTGPGQYGEGDIFIGVTVPDVRSVCKSFQHMPLSEVQKILRSKIHEFRLAALLILVMQFSKADSKEKETLAKFYSKNLKYVNNWDLVDLSAEKILGPYFFERSKAPLYKLLKSKSLWDRRVAILTTFHFIRNHKFEDTLKMSKALMRDEEDLMHKAVGWMLREMGKRNLQVLEKFLHAHATKMPRTMLRYSIERFPEKQRKYFLNKR